MVGELGEEDWEQELAHGCRDLGIRLEGEQARAFRIYIGELLTWNPQAGLISPADQCRLVPRHILDSLVLLRALEPLAGARVLDVGSGGGFPGLPLKICRPQIDMTLLEPMEKKVFFLRHACQALKLKGVSILRQRADEHVSETNTNGKFDLVLTRALASLERLAPMCLPFLREGGLMVAYKGPRAEKEVASAEEQIRLAGGGLQGILAMTVPGLTTTRNLVLLQKNVGK